MRIAFAGTPEFSLAPLRALLASSHQVVGVLTQPDRPAGRGQRLTPGPVKQLALQHALPIDQPPTLRNAPGRAALAQWAPELIVVVAYGLILPQEVLELPRYGCINIHASLLPRWRGAAPIQRALLSGDAETGVCIMQMDVGLDTGPILRMKTLPIRPQTTAGMLSDELSLLGSEELLLALRDLERGVATAQPQAKLGISYAAKISKAEARVDWSRSAQQIQWQVRAFNPWPIAEAQFDGAPLRLHRATAVGEAAARVAPGTVLGLDANFALRIACGSGELAIEVLQRAGRKPVSAREFANGVNISAARLL